MSRNYPTDIERFIYMLGPVEPPCDTRENLSERSVDERWKMILDSAYERGSPIPTRLRNILMDTGDVTVRFGGGGMIPLGNGAYSGWASRKLHDRLDRGFMLIGGLQQGGVQDEWDAEEQNIKDVVRDIALALTGCDIQFVPTKTGVFTGDIPNADDDLVLEEE